MSPFRIALKSKGQVLVVINDEDTLFYESGTELVDQSISLGYFVNSLNNFGLPERASDFALNFTETQGPYRLWNQDMFDHPWHSNWPLYASIPYVVGHASAQTASVAWLNSAETWVDLFQVSNSQSFGQGTHLSYTSEGGAMEFFVFGSATGPKTVQKTLSELSGYAPIPGLSSLGFHYCKWEYNTAEMLIQRNANFTKYGFPVDVLWSDIEYSQNKQYFTFNQSAWPMSQIN
jgi:alpha 1,3-glucosidase